MGAGRGRPRTEAIPRAGTGAGARATSAGGWKGRECSRQSLSDRFDLVIGVAELIAAGCDVSVAELVDGDLEGRARKLCDEVPVANLVPRVATVQELGGLARIPRFPVHRGDETLAGGPVEDLEPLAGDGVGDLHRLADEQLLQLRIIERHRALPLE